MKEEISILLSANEAYARYCAVTMLSILLNTASVDKICFYILTPNFSSESIQRIKELCSRFNAKVSFIPINLNLFNYFPTFHSHFNQNNYSRICGPDLCENCERLVYLDCDLIVLDDIAELFRQNLNGKPIGAVPHVQLPYEETFIKNFSVSRNDTYFNSGVMVINADLWRKEKITESVLALACKYADKLHFADQDAFNAIFWENYFHVPGVWNVEARLYKEKLLGLSQTKEITKRIKLPKIIHYTGPNKPWSSKKYVPKRNLYIEYSERLNSLISWSPDIEIKNFSLPSFTSFIYSCIYFRTCLYSKKILQVNLFSKN